MQFLLNSRSRYNKLMFFLQNIAKKKNYYKFFSLYNIEIKGFDVASIRRVFIYFIKNLLKKI